MIKQIIAVTIMNFKSLPNRFWPSLVIVVGMASVVGVLLSMMSFTTGVISAYAASGDPGRAMVMTPGVQAEFGSQVPRNAMAIIADAPGIAHDGAGKPMVSGEALINMPAKRKDGVDTSMMVRGVGAQGMAMRPEIKLVQGRLFRPGSRELIVGRAAQGQYANIALGDKVTLPDGQWPIVGVFATNNGNITESGFLTDAETLMAANKRPTYNTILVKLTQLSAFEPFRRAVTTNPALQVETERQSAYVVRTTSLIAAVFNGVAYAVGGIMAIGAMFGALNTMYSAVAARTREIATLRALGFGTLPVVISVVSEALLLAVTGALIGAFIAWALFDGHQKSAGNNVFQLMVTPRLVLTGLIWALVVGLIGGLFPAIRAVRLPVATSLRAT